MLLILFVYFFQRTGQFQYFDGFPGQQIASFAHDTSASYDIVVGSGDDTALEPDLQFQLVLQSLRSISGAGVINLTPTVSVAVGDPDGI